MTYPEQCQILKQKQRKLYDEMFPVYIDLIRCQNQLCKDVPDKEVQERADKYNSYDIQIKQLEIAIQVLREEFYDNQRAN